MQGGYFRTVDEMLENFRDTLDWKQVAKQCQICWLHAPLCVEICQPTYLTRVPFGAWHPLRQWQLYAHHRIGSRVETHLGYRRICHHARRLNAGLCYGGVRRSLGRRMVKDLDLEWRG
jgi:hypothetical protein